MSNFSYCHNVFNSVQEIYISQLLYIFSSYFQCSAKNVMLYVGKDRSFISYSSYLLLFSSSYTSSLSQISRGYILSTRSLYLFQERLQFCFRETYLHVIYKSNYCVGFCINTVYTSNYRSLENKTKPHLQEFNF